MNRLTRKQLENVIKDICSDEAAEIYVETGIDFMFDHYDSDIRGVVVRELKNTSRPVTFEILENLHKRLLEINKGLVLLIYCEGEEMDE
ncbi:MAG TPA: hypothetical protein EYN08_00550 [Gammaproteobacteria bacterium]|nr:hypothetical protein [Gammaproteobacteria bacterium]